MSDEVYRVERNIMAFYRPAHVTSRFKTTNIRMTLPDDIRFQMGGEAVVFFSGEVTEGKLTLALRVPDPLWGETEVG